jgi:hypothetical protein
VVKIRSKLSKIIEMKIGKNDERYSVVKPVISKKKEILKTITIDGRNFYFEFGFDTCHNVGLCYDYGWNAPETFEICYYDTRTGWDQIRTFL